MLQNISGSILGAISSLVQMRYSNKPWPSTLWASPLSPISKCIPTEENFNISAPLMIFVPCAFHMSSQSSLGHSYRPHAVMDSAWPEPSLSNLKASAFAENNVRQRNGHIPAMFHEQTDMIARILIEPFEFKPHYARQNQLEEREVGNSN